MSLYKRSRSNSGIHADYTPNLGVMADLRYYDQLADNEYAKLRAFRAYLDEIEDNMLSDGIICEFYEKQNRLKAIILSKCFDFEKQAYSVGRRIVADYGYEFEFHVEVKSHPFREAYLERRGK